MAWYIRKSFKLGSLLRLNLSKSGVGYSFGVKGARIAHGPRGNYVHVGRYGLYYRQALPSNKGAPVSIPSPARDLNQEMPEEIGTAEASTLKDLSAQSLLTEIEQKHRLISIAPISGTVTGALCLILMVQQAPIWVLGVVFLIGAAATVAWSRFDRERKTILLHFNLDDSAKNRYESLLRSIETLSSCSMVWRVQSKEWVRDTKYNAGAGTRILRRRAGIALKAPPFFQTEISVWRLALGDQDLYLFPDRILVYQGRNVGAVSYSELSVEVVPTEFVEDSSVPPDALILRNTWRYTNRNGGPDRRFSNNAQLPVVQYGEAEISSSTGMHIVLQVSSLQKAMMFARGIGEYRRQTISSSEASLTGAAPTP